MSEANELASIAAIFDDDAGSLSDSPELECVGCRTKSKSACPIEARKRLLADTAGEPAAKKPEPDPDEGYLEYEEDLRVAAIRELPSGAAAQPVEEEPVDMADAELLPEPSASTVACKQLAIIDNPAYDGWLAPAGPYKDVFDST